MSKETVVRPVFTGQHSLTLMGCNDHLTDLGRLVEMWGIKTIAAALIDMAIAQERDFLASAENEADREATLEDLAYTTRELAHLAGGLLAAEEAAGSNDRVRPQVRKAHRMIREAIGIDPVVGRRR